ncbi:MAG: gliding motility-associated ABC transporter substrate-binding protein GldG [Chitinophagia bacterium]|nr:gliding motility-associated ABC transporter substrate-binding protein GldG [Chitinophagia bacterium]
MKPKSGLSNIKQSNFQIYTLILIVIAINVLASYFHVGIDLTFERRFTLTTPTKKLLKSMKETAVIDVYLKGKFPADMQRMQEAVRERLALLKSVAGNKLIYRFTDPFEGKNEKEQKEIARELSMRGINYMQLPTQEDEGYSMKICFPYALLQYNGREMPINLLENPPGKDRDEQIAYAEALLEYKFASAINRLQKPSKPRIAYLLDNNEPIAAEHTVDMLSTLDYYYKLDSLRLRSTLHISNAYDAIIINQPTTPIDDRDILKIDQYVMRGGHILWAVKSMNASMDSFGNAQAFIASELNTNTDNILFKYGVRVNKDLVEDLENVPLGQVTMNGRRLYDWVYFPRVNPTQQHPIVRNMDFIKSNFTSSIDTIKADGIQKTILLTSSPYSRTAGMPVRVSLTKMAYPGPPALYNKPNRPLAVLLEGQFHSVFQNRLAPSFLKILADSLHDPFKPQCDSNTSMIVTSIGDIFENDFSQKDGPMPLGYHKWNSVFYANKNFLLNCLEYLTDKSGILEARSKDVKLRLLDKARAKEERTTWQWLNILLPVGLVLIFGSAYMFFRKRKYETVVLKPANA